MLDSSFATAKYDSRLHRLPIGYGKRVIMRERFDGAISAEHKRYSSQ